MNYQTSNIANKRASKMNAQCFSNAFFSHTLKLLAVWPVGQLVPQVKLLSTNPELH